jgi:probable phosphoglycerate mutase
MAEMSSQVMKRQVLKRQLWLFRHGATEWALHGQHTGVTDLPLLPEGEAEARALAPILSNQHFAAVFSSPLQRARRTCVPSGLGEQQGKTTLLNRGELVVGSVSLGLGGYLSWQGITGLALR